jgi:hypothetical protein
MADQAAVVIVIEWPPLWSQWQYSHSRKAGFPMRPE